MEYFMTELSGEWAPDHRGDDTLPMELHMRRTRQDERRRYRFVAKIIVNSILTKRRIYIILIAGTMTTRSEGSYKGPQGVY